MLRNFLRAAGLAASLLLAACNTYPTMAARTAMLSGNAQYYAPSPSAPEKGGRAPLVILVSGCGGLVGLEGPKTVMSDYAAAANRAGAYAVVVDSFGSRGMDFETAVNTTCSGLRLRGNARAGDILAAEALAEKHWNTDFPSVIIAGWSHGGWTVMELLSSGANARHVGNFRIDKPARRALTPDAVALFYPYCGFFNTTAFRKWDFKGPLLLLTAGLDNRSPPEQCIFQIERARGSKDKFESVIFDGVTHAFDESDQIPGSEFKYDPEAAARSHALFQRFVADQTALLN